MFGSKSMDDMSPIQPGGDTESASDAPVTRAEFDELKAKVDKLEADYSEDESEEGEGDSSDDSLGSASIAGAAKSSKPSPMAKKMVGAMNPLKSKPSAKPPFSY